jgi:hypothetical protein
MAKGLKKGAKKPSTLKTAMSAQKNPNSRLHVPQTIGLPGQIRNNAGGYSFPLPLRTECLRYLIIGSKTGNYYQSAGQVSTEISRAILAAVNEPATFKTLMEDLTDVSVKARAPRQEMTMMALAACIVFAPDHECKALALASISQICRIPTHLFMLLENVRGLSQDKPDKPGKGMGKGMRKALAQFYTSRSGEELAVLLTKYKNREGWTHKDIFRLIHINPTEMKDDGARLVLEFFMAEDKPERKTKTGVVIPSTTARADFLKRLAKIPTPERVDGDVDVEQPKPTGVFSSVSSAIGSFFGGGAAAVPAPVVKEPVKVQSPAVRVQVLFEVVHPESPMSGTIKLMVDDTEPLHNIRQTLNDIGIGTIVVFRYNGSLISSTKSLRDISYDPVKKIYLGAGVEPFEPVKPVEPATPVAVAETAQEPKKKQPREDPLTGAARFLKALIAISDTAKDTCKALTILKKNPRLQREHIPTEHMSSSAIWDVLLEGMGLEALIRNLGKLSQIGLAAQKRVKICEMLTNAENVRRSRVHPLKIFIGSKTYGAGKGELGKMTWTVVPEIANTLTQTFKLAFGNVSKSGKRMMIALDVSGSMDCACAGASNITCREGETALALVQVAIEGTANVYIRGFTNTFFNFDGKIRPEMTIQDAIRATSAPFGATDCALPMVTALKDRTPVDVFVVYTDSETYAPTIHPQVALEQYRKEMGIDAKLIVVGMVSNNLSIADPSDRNILNLAGFDTSTPELISMFARGEI